MELIYVRASQVVLVVENALGQCWRHKRQDLIPGLERFPGGGHGNPLKYFSLKNPVRQGSLAGNSP